MLELAHEHEQNLVSHRYKVQFTADQRLHDELKQAQELLRHQVSSGDIAVVFERALDLLIAERKKQLFAQTDKPRTPPADKSRKPDSRHVPHAVRREVLARDGEQWHSTWSHIEPRPTRSRTYGHSAPLRPRGPSSRSTCQSRGRPHCAVLTSLTARWHAM